ncbi:protein HESO1 [Punica granatum]|uniref:Protein HESO1 n=1 Tax=Punica granatum TaxID=22663 RepID=A0A6P8CX65_PUNGR|nr:protein HESO1 [Punica granatum]XP_031383997.1 protein HESO1 [Punica granatum]XP_031383998.1 protein HESO1 [Punica granatum]
MNTNRFDGIINGILAEIKPQQEDWAIRFQVIDELRKVVESVESLRGATVEPFGSFVSNLFTRSGDLDISIQLSYSTHIIFTGKKLKQQLLQELLGALRNGGWRKLQFVERARVPILKFESNHYRILGDISVENLQGQIKSKFLLWLGEIDGRFRDMVLLVKEWAKAQDINNPKYGTINSYSLCLLVIFHFQTCTPPIFPPLIEIYPGNVVDDLKGVRADAERHIAETCAANINRFRSNRSGHINRSSLSELFISFLAKFSGLVAKAVQLGICPYTGRWERLSSNTRWMPKTYAMFVEDPLEQPENTTRAVSNRQLARISEAFNFSYESLLSANQNPSKLLALLGRGPSSRNERHAGGQGSNHRPRAYQAGRPKQQQLQKNGFDRPSPMVGNKLINEGPMQQNLKGSSSHEAWSQPLPNGGKQTWRQTVPNGVKPQQTVKQDRNQPSQSWKPRSGADNKA